VQTTALSVFVPESDGECLNVGRLYYSSAVQANEVLIEDFGLIPNSSTLQGTCSMLPGCLRKNGFKAWESERSVAKARQAGKIPALLWNRFREHGCGAWEREASASPRNSGVPSGQDSRAPAALRCECAPPDRNAGVLPALENPAVQVPRLPRAIRKYENKV
jgi:hypothetical protein